MQPVKQDIKIYQGDTFDFFFRLRTKVLDVPSGLMVPGPYINLTGYTCKSQIRATEESTIVLAEMTTAFANQTTTPGGVFLALTPTQTALLKETVPPSRWDVELTNTIAEIRTYIQGAVKVTKGVTRV